MASSIELSTTSHTRWCRPRVSVEPMYIEGRRRTASSPSRTWRLSAVYEAAAAARPDRPPDVGRVSDSVSGRSAGQALIQPAQVVIVVVLDRDTSSLARSAQRDLGTERVAQPTLQPFQVRTDGGCRALGTRRAVAHLLDPLLSLAYRQAILDDRLQDGPLVRKVR